MNSREKGKVGEREFARLCRDEGYEARRGQQYNGLEGQDVVGLPGVHIEVKRVERINIHDALLQATDDAEQEKAPIVAHRRNNECWKVTMWAEDWFKLYREWEAGECQKQAKI